MGWCLQAIIAAGVALVAVGVPHLVSTGSVLPPARAPSALQGTEPSTDVRVYRCQGLPVAPLLDERQTSCAVLTTQSYQSHAMAAGTVDVVAGTH